jgi:K+-sensing histidine kinase KdpD
LRRLTRGVKKPKHAGELGMSLRVEPERFAGAKDSAARGASADATPNTRSFVRRWFTPITVSLALVGFTTLFLWAIQPALQQDHLIFIYFVPTTLIAIRYGSLSAMGVTIASSLAAAYFLYGPPFSFAVGSRLELMELILFSMLALLASQVVSGFANDSDVAKRRRRGRTESAKDKWMRLKAFVRRLRASL